MRKFEEKDYPQIKEWFERRNVSPVAREFLPSTGIIEDATACGFLIKTEVPIAYLEHFVSNPLAEREERILALSEIASVLIGLAKRDGIKFILCNTKFENIREMAKRQGFIYTGEFSTYYKEIG